MFITIVILIFNKFKEIIMKSAKLLVALAATGLVATSAFAQKSAFEGFYGQIATGYESNSASSLNGSIVDSSRSNFSAPNQTFSTAPLVIGLGYNFSVTPKWVIGLGADYSAMNSKSSTYSSSMSGPGVPAGASLNGQSIELSNRFNVFVAPGYAIDKDKLVYLKAGYSSVSVKGNPPTSYTQPGYREAITGVSSQTSSLSGYVLGLGYKQMITGGLYGFAEGNYMSYTNLNQSQRDMGSTINSSANLSSYQLLVGVGYKF
jgi:outer membrane immunogenic protein